MLPLISFELAPYLQILLAAVLGALIGIERELNERPAGLRTHILVTMGATLFTIISVGLGTDFVNVVDPTRIAAGIVTGIGFLGAGSIIHNQDGIKGLTTAADLWVSAAIGLAVGVNEWLLAAFATGLVLLVLVMGRKIDQKIIRARQELKSRGMLEPDSH